MKRTKPARLMVGTASLERLLHRLDILRCCGCDLLERHLHEALKRLGVEKAGHHAFRRFRVTWLRKQRCPDDLRHFWLGHAGRSVEDDYDRMREDVEFRKQVVEGVGLGFEIPASTPSIVPNVPKLAVEEVEEVAVSF